MRPSVRTQDFLLALPVLVNFLWQFAQVEAKSISAAVKSYNLREFEYN